MTERLRVNEELNNLCELLSMIIAVGAVVKLAFTVFLLQDVVPPALAACLDAAS
jgi:hypothetical protein